MGVPTRTRIALFTLLTLFTTSSLLAGFPSARSQARMVFDPVTTHTILFGGVSDPDAGTAQSYDLNETWTWTGIRWVQRFPATVPAARSSHVMVYDNTRSRIVMFGGKSGKAELADTWMYRDNNWTDITPSTSPGKRILAGAAYDSVRDRIVLFGGTETTIEGNKTTQKSLTDTWEFDGVSWRRISETGPAVSKPVLVYDQERNQVLMLGINDKQESLMYTYDAAAGTWAQKTPESLPKCVNESALTYQPHNQTVLLTGGVCLNLTGDDLLDTAYEWNGNEWTKVVSETKPERASGHSQSYDAERRITLIFGGVVAFGTARSSTWGYRDGAFNQFFDSSSPAPRSLFAFRRDPVSNVIWLFGGLNEAAFFTDLWKYQNGQWQPVASTDGPSGCTTPAAAFDTDRQKLIVYCSASELHEWDGSTWKKFAFSDLKSKPDARRFNTLVYDPTLKKTVFFGGYEVGKYFDDTWLWDGATFTEITKGRPTSRGLHSMWYDPVLKKVVIYGGIGRKNSDDRIERWSDMWSFDGTRWTDMKITATPGPRYGAQTAVDPRTNKVLLFGGLRLTTDDKGLQTQTYVDDTWEWSGSAWTQLSPATKAPARENGGLEYDPSLGQMVLFAGWAGHFLSDTWIYENNAWKPRTEALGPRRRPAPVVPSPPVSPKSGTNN